jgi:hypothetical protein
MSGELSDHDRALLVGLDLNISRPAGANGRGPPSPGSWIVDRAGWRLEREVPTASRLSVLVATP